MSFDLWNNQADVADPRAIFAAQQKANTPQPKQNTNTHGNFLTHLIPTFGGTAGGVGGAAIGTAIAPGIGTLVGALLGGALGGGAGKVVENKKEGQGTFNGVGGQALEQGVLSAGPLRLLKAGATAAKAAPEVATGAKTLAEALSGAGDAAVKPGMLAKTGKNLVTQGEQAQGRVAGVSAGSKVPGHELTPQDTKAMLDTLKSEGIKTGNANNTLRDIQDKLNQYGKQITGHFTENNTPLTAAKTNKLASDYVNGLNTTDPSVLKQAQTLANDLKKNVSDTKSLWEFRKTLDSRIPDSKFMDAATTDKVTALKAMRQFVSDQLGTVPGASNYHDLSSIKPFISSEAKRLNNPGGGIVGRIAASGPVQKTEQLLGKGTESVGKSLGGNNPFGLQGIAGRTVPVGVLQAGGSSIQNPSTATTTNTMPTQMSSDNIGNTLPQNGNMSSTAGGNSPYGQENLMYDISRDPANAAKYISTYESLQKVFNPAPSTTGNIKPTSQQYGLAQGGMNALNQLSQLIQQDPSVVNRNATLGQGLPVVGSLISNAAGAGTYHPLADSVLQSLIHLQTGATATPEEVKAARGQLPQPGDSPEEQQRKIQNLTAMLSPFLQGGSTSNSQPDLASALAAMGYGQ